MTASKPSTLLQAGRIAGLVFGSAGLVFGGNLLARCDDLHTDTEAALINTAADKRMTRVETTLGTVVKALAGMSTQIAILQDREERAP